MDAYEADTHTEAEGGRDEIARILALGYLRLRKRQAALAAAAYRRANPLDDVAPEGRFATGDCRTSKTGVTHG